MEIATRRWSKRVSEASRGLPNTGARERISGLAARRATGPALDRLERANRY
jgi:hypothetical protein